MHPSRALVGLTCALAAPLLVSCGSDSTGVDDKNVVATVTLAPPSLTVEIGQTAQLTATARNADGDILTPSVTWSSSPSGIVTINGSTGQVTVTGLSEGVATITATAEGRSGSASATVNDPFPPSAPSGVEATPVSDTRIDVTWVDNSDTEDSFVIERESVGAGAPSEGPSGPAAVFAEVGSVGADVTTFQDTGVDPGTTYRYQVRSCNENGCSDSADDPAVVETFETLEIETAALPDGAVDTPYEQTLVAAGGNGEVMWSVSDGTLPPGLTLAASTGVLSGTPTTAGDFDFTVQAVGAGQTVTRALSISVAMYAVLEITTSSLPDGQVGTPYAQAVTATGGDGDNTWSIASGDLPPGLDIAPGTGQISGDPGADGTFDFTVEVNSGDGQMAQADLSIVIAPEPVPVVITTTNLPDGEVGTPYLQPLLATGGTGVFTWSVTAGNLPAGLGLDADFGVIFGTPTEEGTFDFTVQAESGGADDTQDLSLTIAPEPLKLDTDVLVGAYPGAAYSDFFEASGGDGTYVFSHTGGTLPDGLSLNTASGELSGTPSVPGAYFFTIQVSSDGENVSKTYALAISTRPDGAFNVAIMNVAGNTIPSAAVITGLSAALARWESVIVGDLGAQSYGTFPNIIPPGFCGGHGPKLNGFTVDDVMVIVDLANIDGPGMTLGSAGPCDFRIYPNPSVNFATTFGRLKLDTSDLAGLDPVQMSSLIFHEIGHIIGIGTLWDLYSFIGPFVGQPGAMDLISDAIEDGGTAPKYEGVNGNAVYTGSLGGGSSGTETKIPIEDEGGEGTQDAHWEESEFDNEIMTGWAEASGVMMPVSEMTIAAVGDFRYTVDTAAADAFVIPGCAPACVAAPPPPPGFGAPGIGDRLMDDILDEPIRGVLPDGTTIIIPAPSER